MAVKIKQSYETETFINSLGEYVIKQHQDDHEQVLICLNRAQAEQIANDLFSELANENAWCSEE